MSKITEGETVAYNDEVSSCPGYNFPESYIYLLELGYIGLSISPEIVRIGRIKCRQGFCQSSYNEYSVSGSSPDMFVIVPVVKIAVLIVTIVIVMMVMIMVVVMVMVVMIVVVVVVIVTMSVVMIVVVMFHAFDKFFCQWVVNHFYKPHDSWPATRGYSGCFQNSSHPHRAVAARIYEKIAVPDAYYVPRAGFKGMAFHTRRGQ
jgi:hypothetical protein